MSKLIPKFTHGNKTGISKLNNLISELKTISDIKGDGFVKVTKNNGACTIGLNLHVLQQRLFHGGMVSSGGGSSDVLFEKYDVITCPVDPSGDNPSGNPYYTLRLSTDNFEEWVVDFEESANGGPGYPAGEKVIHPDTKRLYQNIQEEGLNTEPLTNEEAWTMLEETKVTKIWGYGTETILNFMPVIPVGGKVWVFFVTEDEVEVPYILGTFLYVGTATERTITMVRNDADTKDIMGAVFR